MTLPRELVTHHVDADGRTATFNYDPRTLRLYSQSLPAKPQSQTPSSPFPTPSPPRAMIIYSYNDQALSTTARTAVFNAVGQPLQTASQTVVFRDGRGLTREQRSQAADGSSWDVVASDTILWGAFNANPCLTALTRAGLQSGRSSGRALPTIRWAGSRLPRPQIRMAGLRYPGRSSTRRSGLRQRQCTSGTTVRTVDPVGREKWMSLDPLGRVVEVWEPDPAGTGSVLSPGGFQSFISYNGSTVWIQQGQRGLSLPVRWSRSPHSAGASRSRRHGAVAGGQPDLQ